MRLGDVTIPDALHASLGAPPCIGTQIQLIATVTTIKWITFNSGACCACDTLGAGANRSRRLVVIPRTDMESIGPDCREYSVVKYSTSRCALAHGHPGGLRAEPEAISAGSKAVAGRASASVRSR